MLKSIAARHHRPLGRQLMTKSAWRVSPPFLTMAPPELTDVWDPAEIKHNAHLAACNHADFNGHISLGNYSLTLPRGSSGLDSIPPHWENRLVWHTPKDGDDELIYVNKHGRKYRCNFIPID